MTTKTSGIAEATSKLDVARLGARDAAHDAILDMLVVLRRSLGADRMRGMPNLATSSRPYRALRVRARHADKALPFPRDRHGDGWSDPVLVLTERGAITLVRRNEAGDFNEAEVDEADLKAEDVEHVAETIVEACDRHLAASERATTQYDDLRMLAGRIRTALEGQ